MTEDEETLLLIKGAISDLSTDDQRQIQELLTKVETIFAEYEPTICGYALALVGAAAACKE